VAPLVGQALPPANLGLDQELAGGSACPTFAMIPVFHGISRAEGPFKQTTKDDGLSHVNPR
jgi:hypothetical protein